MLFNTKDATRCYRESLKLDPHESQVMNNLGTVYASLKDMGRRTECIARPQARPQVGDRSLRNYGTNLLAEHKYNRGWEAYQQALTIDPQIFADHDGPPVAESLQRAGSGRNELLHGGGLRARRLHRLRPASTSAWPSMKALPARKKVASRYRSSPAFAITPPFKQLLAEQHN